MASPPRRMPPRLSCYNCGACRAQWRAWRAGERDRSVLDYLALEVVDATITGLRNAAATSTGYVDDLQYCRQLSDFAGGCNVDWSLFESDLAEAGSIDALFARDMANPLWPRPAAKSVDGCWDIQIDRRIFDNWDATDYQRVLERLERQRYAELLALMLARPLVVEPLIEPPPDWLQIATVSVLTAAPPTAPWVLAA